MTPFNTSEMAHKMLTGLILVKIYRNFVDKLFVSGDKKAKLIEDMSRKSRGNFLNFD